MATIPDINVEVSEAKISENTIIFFEVGKEILAKLEGEAASKFAEKMAGPSGSTFIEASVVMVNEEYGHRDKIDWRTGQVCERTYTGITTRSMSAQDLMSGRMIENLPAALDCQPGDIVRITVEVIKSNDQREGLATEAVLRNPKKQ